MKKVKEEEKKDEMKETQDEELRQTILFTSVLIHTNIRAHACAHIVTHTHTHTRTRARALTHKRFYAQTLALTHRRFYTQTLSHKRLPQITILAQVLTLEPHFVRKGGHFVVPRRRRPRPIARGLKREKNYTTVDPKQWVNSRSVLGNKVKDMK